MIDPFKELDKRARLALRQALESGTGTAPSEVVRKLERRGLAQRSGHTHETTEWGKVVRRWPKFWLTDEGKKIAQTIVDRLRSAEPQAHATTKSPRRLDREIAATLAKYASTPEPGGYGSSDEGVFYLTDTREHPLGPEFRSRLAAKRAAMKLVREGAHPRVEVWHRWRGDRYMQGLASEEGWSDV